ncbi:amidase [Fulvimarina endophytica]|uniref:Indoleacetamide hydrolase n=2 Tax=Fulvimarina endophytica TaxID=2293836 RepID=A0A371X5N5_9HYPH|nr:amidase [Fulvimarina endophytica]
MAAIPEPCDESAVSLAAKIRTGALSATECVSGFLSHIEAVNPVHNAIVSLRPREEILADAARADAARAKGEALGPLHGLPIAIKDLSPTAGLTTTFGSPIYCGFVPDEDGLATARVRAAGAIVIGKTNTPEFGLGSHTFNEVFGATGNAFDPARSAGGSSGGAAVALATRMLPIADGSDMGGSLRNPAAFNNVFGLRPSFGRVPAHPSGNVFEASLATDGPMARSAEDLALLLGIQAGADPRQPLSFGLPSLGQTRIIEGTGIRIGWLADLGGHLPFEAGILESVETALDAIPGARIEPVSIGLDPERIWQAFSVLRQIEIAGRYGALLGDPRTRDLLKPEFVWEIEGGRRRTGLDGFLARQTRAELHIEMAALFERFDMVSLPAAQVFPFPVGWRWPRSVAGREMDSYHRWMECVALGTLSGCPVLAAPAGFRGGLACGFQLIAPHGREADLLAVARRMERG